MVNQEVKKFFCSSSDSGEEDEEDSDGRILGQYGAQDYADLSTTSEIQDLFQLIYRYQFRDFELPFTPKCFIPDYLPAIGEMDMFIKVFTRKFNWTYR